VLSRAQRESEDRVAVMHLLLSSVYRVVDVKRSLMEAEVWAGEKRLSTRSTERLRSAAVTAARRSLVHVLS
jgi:hypothetical protein